MGPRRIEVVESVCRFIQVWLSVRFAFGFGFRFGFGLAVAVAVAACEWPREPKAANWSRRRRRHSGS